MRLQAVTQQSKKAISDQRIAARQTCCYIPPAMYASSTLTLQSAISGGDHKQGERMLQDNSNTAFECTSRSDN